MLLICNILFLQIPNLIEQCAKSIINQECGLADAWAMVLSNISRPEQLAEQVFEDLENYIEQLVTAFTRIDYNQKKCHLNYLGPIFSNLSQISKGRNYFCNHHSDLLSRLVPFVHYDDSIVRKGGAIGLLKNICFDSSRHEYLLQEIDVLPLILLPLAGPEEYSDEESDKFPVELQVIYK